MRRTRIRQILYIYTPPHIFVLTSRAMSDMPVCNNIKDRPIPIDSLLLNALGNIGK